MSARRTHGTAIVSSLMRRPPPVYSGSTSPQRTDVVSTCLFRRAETAIFGLLVYSFFFLKSGFTCRYAGLRSADMISDEPPFTSSQALL